MGIGFEQKIAKSAKGLRGKGVLGQEDELGGGSNEEVRTSRALKNSAPRRLE
jgi:hypothetical protein